MINNFKVKLLHTFSSRSMDYPSTDIKIIYAGHKAKATARGNCFPLPTLFFAAQLRMRINKGEYATTNSFDSLLAC